MSELREQSMEAIAKQEEINRLVAREKELIPTLPPSLRGKARLTSSREQFYASKEEAYQHLRDEIDSGEAPVENAFLSAQEVVIGTTPDGDRIVLAPRSRFNSGSELQLPRAEQAKIAEERERQEFAAIIEEAKNSGKFTTTETGWEAAWVGGKLKEKPA